MAVETITQQSPVAATTDRADNFDNPLRKYASYSYHFILVAIDSTDILTYTGQSQPNSNSNTTTANNASTTNNTSGTIGINSIDFYERPSGPDPRAVKSCLVGNYSIVIDTRYDTDFFIQDAEWGTAFIGNARDPTSTFGLNTYVNDGVLNVIEPRGVNFLNVLAQTASNKYLGLDPSVMPFLLKIIFVGHNDDGTVDQITNIPPYGILITNIEGNIDATGSMYKLSFCGCDNGAGWTQIYLGMTDGIGFTFGGRNPSNYGAPYTLEEHLQTFQEQMNHAYLARRNVIIQNLLASSAHVDLSKTAKITWKIVLEPSSIVLQNLKDFGTLIPDTGKPGGSSNPYQYIGKKDGGVVDLIDKLMASSATWAKYQVEGDPNVVTLPKNGTPKYSYKITTEFQRTSPDKGDNSITIIYYVSEYQYQAVDLTPSEEGNAQSQTLDLSNSTVYTFDYIYTGKNADVIHLDMNLSMGLALWQNLITARSLPNQQLDVTGKILTPDFVPILTPSGALNPNNEIRLGTPIWPPAYSDYADSLKEHLNQPSVQTADAIWRQFAGYQSVNTKMVIHGNPLFLQKFTNPSKYGPDYVKVNIKMPSTTDDIWEYEQSSNPTPGGYYKTFWYDGYFNIITAQNKFNDGQFTQELNLWQVPGISASMQSVNDKDELTGVGTPSVSSIYTPQKQSITSTASTPPNLSTNTNPITPGRSLGHKTGTGISPSSNTLFVQMYYNQALAASQRVAATYGTPPIDPNYILAAAAVESTHPGGNWGSSGLTTGYNNFFGFKAFPNNPNNAFWTGQIVPLQTTEVVHGVTTPTTANFRVYSDAQSSFGDYARLISQRYGNADSSTTIQNYANAVQNKPGGGSYSTNPNYQALLISDYNQILTIEAALGITPNMPYTGPNATGASSQANASPFLASTTQPNNTVAPATPTSYSATDRLVQDAAVTQKTLITVLAGKAH
jgi:flagellum-specific peptidoglycan hydrolase FlgJ